MCLPMTREHNGFNEEPAGERAHAAGPRARRRPGDSGRPWRTKRLRPVPRPRAADPRGLAVVRVAAMRAAAGGRAVRAGQRWDHALARRR